MSTPQAIPAIHRLAAVARSCDQNLNDHEGLAAACHRAVATTGLSAVSEAAYAFVPHGFSIALLLAQSHLVVSTWPEYRLATVDLAVCSGARAAQAVWTVLNAYLQPAVADVSLVCISLHAA